MELPQDLKDYSSSADEPGFLGVLRDLFNALAIFAVSFLVVLAVLSLAVA